MPDPWYRKVWYFLWEEDSVWSWIANVILAFVLIKFIVYPALGFMLSTTHPIVAVVSGSMEHDGNFETWWESACTGQMQSDLYTDFGISKQQFKTFTMQNGFNKGDIIILKGKQSYEVGDIIVYSIPLQADPIIHRIVKIDSSSGQNVYKTKGDHNCGLNPFEESISQSQVIGGAAVRVPWLGWVKIMFVEIVWRVMSIFG